MNNFMKSFTIPLLAIIALPTAIQANIDYRVAEKCLKETESKGCIKISFGPEKISSSILPLELDISLSVNGKIKQQANTRDMIFSVSEIISDLSAFFTLLPGDLVFTGTPQGVGPVFPGDVLEARIDELPCLSVAIQ